MIIHLCQYVCNVHVWCLTVPVHERGHIGWFIAVGYSRQCLNVASRVYIRDKSVEPCSPTVNSFFLKMTYTGLSSGRWPR